MDDSRFQERGLLSLQASAAPIVAGKPVLPDEYGPPDGTSLNFAVQPSEGTAELQQEQTPERTAALDKDPLLGAKRIFQRRPKPAEAPEESEGAGWDSLRGWLPDLARVYGVSIIADAYRADNWGFGSPGTEPITLAQLLDRFVGRFYHWDQHGKLVRLRFREWAFARREEVP